MSISNIVRVVVFHKPLAILMAPAVHKLILVVVIQYCEIMSVFSVENNNNSDKSADDIAAVLSLNTKLQWFLRSDNNVKSAGASENFTRYYHPENI